MQLITFDYHCRAIAEACSQIDRKLKYEKIFNNKERKIFNNALNHLSFLFKQDVAYFNSYQQHPLWHTAYRIVQLSNLSEVLNSVLQNIQSLKGPKYFCHKLPKEILPALAQRIEHLRIYAFQTYCVPFEVKTARELFVEKIKKGINQVEIAHIYEVEKDYFHLLGDHFKPEQLAMISQQYLDGSTEVHSLLSWTNIIRLASENTTTRADKEKYSCLLNIMSQALSFSTKVVMTNSCIHQTRVSNHQGFPNQYSLNQISQVPLKIIEEMVWDMLHAISSMEKGDTRLFLLGSKSHRIAVQITCTASQSVNQSPLYKYEIFNTGRGAPCHFLKVENNQISALPVTYLNVPENAFNYSFLLNLIISVFSENQIENFYQLHDYFLVYLGKGKKSFIQGDWYPLQKHGTCAYMSLEAWIRSQLNPQQFKKIEFIKAAIATQKQRQIVNLLEQNQTTFIALGRTLIYVPEKLKQSRILLQLGREHLSHCSSI